MSRSSLAWCFVVVVSVSTFGCGDDDRPPMPRVDAGPRIDSGPRDAGSFDGGPDTGPTPDGGPDAGGAMALSCRYDLAAGDVIRLGTDSGDDSRIVAIAPQESSFLVSWSAVTLALPDVHVRQIPSIGMPPMAHTLTMGAGIAGGPAALWTGSSGLVAFFDNSMGNYEIWVQPVGADGAPMGMRQRLTMNALRDDDPALFQVGTEVLAAFVQDDFMASERIALTRRLAGSGAPSSAAIAVTAPPRSPSDAVLARIGANHALVWAESGGQVWLQPLTGTGMTRGAAVPVSAEGNADGSVDAVGTEDGGAVVFGVTGSRPEVRLRLFDMDGTLTVGERTLTPPPDQTGTDPSIAYFAGGYVVAMRGFTPAGETPAQLRLLLVDGLSGDTLDKVDLLGISDMGGRVTVRVTTDGRTMLIGWVDAGTETTINVLRLHCD